MSLTWQRTLFLAVFLGTFGLYLHTMGPTLVPYRDAGEMATTVTRLGVVHPPGYPTYTLVGHLFTKLPFANPAYRLNLLSALALACAWLLLLMLFCELWGTYVGVLAVLLAAVSFQFWMHALISEMYTFHLLVISSVLYLLFHRKFELAAFVFGLGLGVRMDLLLCAPAFVLLFLGQTPRQEWGKRTLYCFFFFVLGTSVYLYLIIRANGQPLLNWGDPSTWERFLASVSRRSYGSSLDLLAQNYQRGENFLSQWKLYMKHVVRDFTGLSVPLIMLGVVHLWRSKKLWFGATLLGWLLTGPLFIYLGNLPINPHAVAIMEAAYLMPDLFLLGSIAAGLAFIQNHFPVQPEKRFGSPVFVGISLLMVVLIVAQGMRFFPAIDKRRNFVLHDFIRNVFRSVPEPSLIVARSDVPVFSLFYGHWVSPGSKWRVPIAQGLAGSAWYPVMMAQQIPKLQITPLRTAAEWDAMAKANPGWSLYGSHDTDWPPELYPRMASSGLLMQYLPRGETSLLASDTWLDEYSIYRGRYRYDAYYEFFTPEVIEEYAKAWMEWGRLALRSNQIPAAKIGFLHSLSLKPDMPYPAFQLGFMYFQQNKLAEADYYYHWSLDNFRVMERQAEAWKSLPALRESLQRDEAQAMAHWGVVQERLGNPERAVSLYKQSLMIDPNCADARYNLAVIYWRSRRWHEVVENLQAMAVSHPEDPRWRVYLPKALENLEKNK